MSHPAYQRILLFLAPLLLAVTNSAWSEISLGHRGALAVGGEAELEYNSNISANSSEDGDTIARVLPKVLYRYDQGIVAVDAFIGVEFKEYDEQSQFDSDSFKSGLVIEYPSEAGDAPFDLRLKAGYNESSRADGDLQTIVDREVTQFSLSGKYYLADRYYLKAGSDWKDDEIVPAGFNDVTTLSIPVSLFYRYSEDLAFGLGYRYRQTTVDGAAPTADSSDDAVYIELEGALTPHIQAEIKLGLQQRDFEVSTFDDTDSVFVEISTAWRINERSRLKLTAGNDLGTAASNAALEKLYVEVELRHKFDEKLTATATAIYEERDYNNLAGVEYRNDDEWLLELDVEYELIEERLTLFAKASYGDQSSNVLTADYKSSSVSCGVSFIY